MSGGEKFLVKNCNFGFRRRGSVLYNFFKWHNHLSDLVAVGTMPADYQFIAAGNAYLGKVITLLSTSASKVNQSVHKLVVHGKPPQSAVGCSATGRTSGRSSELGRWQTNTASGSDDRRNTASVDRALFLPLPGEAKQFACLLPEHCLPKVKGCSLRVSKANERYCFGLTLK